MTGNRYSEKMLEMPPSPIRKFFEFITGRDDIISLGIGEPDFATPWAMREEAWFHLEQGHTSYTSNWGLLELRKAVADYLRGYGMDYDPETEVLITVGVSEAIDTVFRAILNPQDEIIVAEPCYVSYQPLAELCGATLVRLDTSRDGFVPTAARIREKLTPRTKVVMICSPSNPTGRMIPAEELERIAALAIENDLWVLSDEVYCELTYDGRRHVSIGSLPGMKERAIVLNGFSKSFAMTGWRIGFMAACAELVGYVNKLHQYSTICAPIMSQYAALEGLRHGFGEVERMRLSYQQRRNLMMAGFEEMGLPFIEPEGAFYIFPDIRQTGLSSDKFAERLISDYKVAVVPGTAFGACGEGFVRCCYAMDVPKLKEALRRIALMLKGAPLDA